MQPSVHVQGCRPSLKWKLLPLVHDSFHLMTGALPLLLDLHHGGSRFPHILTLCLCPHHVLHEGGGSKGTVS